MNVSIIIVNYNTLELTNNCIESIVSFTKKVSFEIILVDNASKDGSKEFFENDNRIKYIYSEENLGFGKANNLGTVYAKGEYLFLLNSDTLLVNDAIELFYNFAISAPSNIACIGSLLLNEKLEIIHSYGNFPSYLNTIDEWVIYPILRQLGIKKSPSKFDSPKKRRKNSFYVDYVTGANIFLRKKIATDYGLFDPDFFMYYEETELQYRYCIHKFKSVVLEGPKIIHISEGSSSVDNRFRKKLFFLKGLYIFFKKHKNNFELKLFWSFFLFFTIFVMLLYPVSFSEKRYVIKNLLKKSFYKINPKNII